MGILEHQRASPGHTVAQLVSVAGLPAGRRAEASQIPVPAVPASARACSVPRRCQYAVPLWRGTPGRFPGHDPQGPNAATPDRGPFARRPTPALRSARVPKVPREQSRHRPPRSQTRYAMLPDQIQKALMSLGSSGMCPARPRIRPPPRIMSGPHSNRAGKPLHARAVSGVEKDRRTTESPADITPRRGRRQVRTPGLATAIGSTIAPAPSRHPPGDSPHGSSVWKLRNPPNQ